MLILAALKALHGLGLSTWKAVYLVTITAAYAMLLASAVVSRFSQSNVEAAALFGTVGGGMAPTAYLLAVAFLTCL